MSWQPTRGRRKAVLDAADAEAVKLGAGLNKAYAAALRMGKKGQYTSVLERAKEVAGDYLTHFEGRTSKNYQS